MNSSKESMKILYIGTFDNQNKSTNNSQYRALKRLGHEVFQHNYRLIEQQVGTDKCNRDLISSIQKEMFDLVLISKGTLLNTVVSKMCNLTTVGLWYMDPLISTSFSPDVQERCKIVNFVCCDKMNVLEQCLKLNKNSFHVCEGYDRDVDRPVTCEKEFDVSFIGDIYGDRESILRSCNYPITIIQGAYGTNHATVVSKSKINLNMVTNLGASDRVYKVMAAGGFLLTNDWIGRKEMFEDSRHLVIFKNLEDLAQKIQFFIDNPDSREKIAQAGYEKVQKYNRDLWAKEVIEAYHQCK